jgi:hypothetical protein
MKMALAVGLASLVLGIGVSPNLPATKSGKRKVKITYAKDVAPILNNRCISCHRPNEVAPFSLVGYDNAKKWGKMASIVAGARQMPPWKAVHGFGEFKDEARLSDQEIKTLSDWVYDEMPRGDRRLEPPTRSFSSEDWPLGKPDLVIQPSRTFQVEANGPDVYRNFVIHTDFKEPTWINGMEIKPGNRKVVHHVITYLDGNHAARKLEARSRDGQEGYTSSGGGVGILPTGSLGGWAPGFQSRLSPPGTAFLVNPGTDLIIQVHYHKSGKAESDLTKVGLYFAKTPVESEMKLNWLFNFNVNIPPGEKNYVLRQEFTFPKDVVMYAAMPHMHLLGRSMKAWLEYPDGSKKPLVYIDDWDFNWQLSYAFKDPIHVPKGTKEVVEAVYDNSADNVRNPNNPPKRVTWGEETTDEMFLLITPYTLEKSAK